MSPVCIPPFLLVLELVCSLVSPPVLVRQCILVFLVVLEYYYISEPQLDEAHSYIPVFQPVTKNQIKSYVILSNLVKSYVTCLGTSLHS